MTPHTRSAVVNLLQEDDNLESVDIGHFDAEPKFGVSANFLNTEAGKKLSEFFEKQKRLNNTLSKGLKLVKQIESKVIRKSKKKA